MLKGFNSLSKNINFYMYIQILFIAVQMFVYVRYTNNLDVVHIYESVIITKFLYISAIGVGLLHLIEAVSTRSVCLNFVPVLISFVPFIVETLVVFNI